MQPILEIRDVSKRFTISHETQPYLSLRDSIINVFKKSAHSNEQFYALKDINFNIEPGESIGIIGRNGAGKSTLLKILSKITPPSSGKIISRGRIASLLEVGTGFHPELTGRENIFLNGSILGMKRREIQEKFDEIVDFSGTEKFLDTALKHFSSGMQLRLAFSVAAFLEPEILVIDEVLAVGDMEFQKKCIGKMEEVGRSGRTILFVSHNLGAVAQLCKRAIVIQSGKLIYSDTADKAIQFYFNSLNNDALGRTLSGRKDRQGNGLFRFCAYEFLDKTQQPVQVFRSGEELRIQLTLEAREANAETNAYATLVIKDINGSRLLGLASGYYRKEVKVKDKSTITWVIPNCPIAPGEYSCDVNLYEGLMGGIAIDYLQDAFRLNIEEGDYFRTGFIPNVRRDKMYCDFDVYSSNE